MELFIAGENANRHDNTDVYPRENCIAPAKVSDFYSGTLTELPRLRRHNKNNEQTRDTDILATLCQQQFALGVN